MKVAFCFCKFGKEREKNNIESCHFNEQPLVGLHKVKVIKFSPDV